MDDSLLLAELRHIGMRLTVIEERLKIKQQGAFTPDERKERQIKFIVAYNDLFGISSACRYAGISRQSFYEWREKDKWFMEQLRLCRRGEWTQEFAEASFPQP